MFNDEFSGLPLDIQVALREQLEEFIRSIYNSGNSAKRDSSYKTYSAEQITSTITSVFDLAQRLKNNQN